MSRYTRLPCFAMGKSFFRSKISRSILAIPSARRSRQRCTMSWRSGGPRARKKIGIGAELPTSSHDRISSVRPQGFSVSVDGAKASRGKRARKARWRLPNWRSASKMCLPQHSSGKQLRRIALAWNAIVHLRPREPKTRCTKTPSKLKAHGSVLRAS